MNAERLHMMRERFQEDREYASERQRFRDNYEWLEAFWSSGYHHFIARYYNYYWECSDIKEIGRQFAKLECVGNSKDQLYRQTGEISKCIMHLRHSAGLFPVGAEPSCDSAGCRTRKVNVAECIASRSQDWPEGAREGFKAVMEIMRQIRNNLVHGNKFELQPEQFRRNRELVQIADKLSELVWSRLPEAERSTA